MVINVLPGNCDLQNFATNNSKLVLFLPGAYSLKFILMLYHYLFICHVNSSHMTFWTNQLTQSKTVPPTATAEIQNVHSLQLLWDHQSTTIVPTGEISKRIFCWEFLLPSYDRDILYWAYVPVQHLVFPKQNLNDGYRNGIEHWTESLKNIFLYFDPSTNEDSCEKSKWRIQILLLNTCTIGIWGLSIEALMNSLIGIKTF